MARMPRPAEAMVFCETQQRERGGRSLRVRSVSSVDLAVFVSRAAVILLWGGEEGKKESPGPREGDQRRTRSSFPKPSFFTYRGGDELLVVGTGLADEPGVAARHGDAGGAGLAGRDALAHEVLVSDGWGHGCLSSSVLWCSLVARARLLCCETSL